MANTFRPAGALCAYQDFCPAGQRRFVLIAAILTSAMGFIDGTVVSIAIPAIRRSLEASLTEMQWVNNAYMLTLSALILAGGSAGDRFGLRRVLVVGILVFIAASLACAIATSASFLIGARAVQGIGAALMVPGSLAIISKTYPQKERARAIGIWAAASAFATAGGPILGGALLSLGGSEMWRLIFAINLPVGAIVLYLLIVRVPDDRPVTDDPPDWTGAALATAALGLFAWALTGSGGGIEGEGGLPGAPHMLLYGVAAIAVFLTLLRVEKARCPANAAAASLPLRRVRRGQRPDLLPLLRALCRPVLSANDHGFRLGAAGKRSRVHLPATLRGHCTGLRPGLNAECESRPRPDDRRRLLHRRGCLRHSGRRHVTQSVLGSCHPVDVPDGDWNGPRRRPVVGSGHGRRGR